MQFSLTRLASIPDPIRLDRYRRTPEFGPKILFFSGGSALCESSQLLVQYTHNSIHLVTPFDSGGSSASLREAFRMLAVGDLRNRLIALADRSAKGQLKGLELFSFRFPKQAKPDLLRLRLGRMVDGKDEMVQCLPESIRKIICGNLKYLFNNIPENFDLRGASIGNLILAGGYLNYNREIDPVVFLFSKLAEVKGVVCPVSSEYLHLCAELEDNSTIAGQHLICGKEVSDIESPIKELFLSHSRIEPSPCVVSTSNRVLGLIKEADLICYPMGSFYTSLIASLLPQGIGRAVAETIVPKVYIPNAGHDPEQLGLTVADSIHLLIRYLRQGLDNNIPANCFINYVLLDEKAVSLPLGNLKEIDKLGIQIIHLPLSANSKKKNSLYSSEKVVESILSFT